MRRILAIVTICGALVGCYNLPFYPKNGPGCLPTPPGPEFIPGRPEGGGTWYSYGNPYGKSRYEDSCIEPL